MRCIINVAIGGRYPKEQKRLGESLAKHFQGDFLSWTDFPNDNYNKANPYNTKAAAFEEAMKKGYTQILWVDSPVVALKAVSPIFDSIVKNGYLTMKNGQYNCAQTCSDACLAYFKVSRDQAETFQEHAGGIIGIDTTHPKGKQLIDLFIQACKNGACDGSRKHDGQSKDPRFKFHRQCQSVISLAANTLGLPPTMNMNELITVDTSKKNEHTILCWSHRGKHILSANGRHTRRIRRPKRGGTRNATHGYIYLQTSSGLNDCLVQLAKCTKYAIQHHRSIILEMPMYSATDLDTVFDFSKYPVPILTNHKEMQKELAKNPIEPPYYGTLADPITRKHKTNRKWSTEDGKILEFDFAKSYPITTVLVYAAGRGGEGDDSINILEHIRLRPAVLEAYRQKLKEYSVPTEYNSIHLRATDRKLNITNNITGMLTKDSNSIIKQPSSGNTHADSLKKIDAFLKAHTLPVFISGDNPKLIEKLSAKYPQILYSSSPNNNKECTSNRECTALHKQGHENPDILKNAVVDLLILAGAKSIMTSAGGYSRLAKKLSERKDILKKLLS
jgi:hypothetical protein